MKYLNPVHLTHRISSLPSRERGLKLRIPFSATNTLIMSLPSRERGLKSCSGQIGKGMGRSVAPFAGAWIEISMEFVQVCSLFVAPFAGAWIEIIGFLQ